MVTVNVPGFTNTCVKVEPGAWFSVGVPSPKFQMVLFKVTPTGTVDKSVNDLGVFSQVGETCVNRACAVSNK